MSHHQGQIQPSPDDTHRVTGLGSDKSEGSAFTSPTEESAPVSEYFFGAAPDYRSLVTSKDVAMLGNCCLTDSTGQPVDAFGRPLTTDLDSKGAHGFDSQFAQGVLRALDPRHPSAEQLAGLSRWVDAPKLAEALLQAEKISPAEQQSRVNSAHQDCYAALGKIMNGSADAGVIGDLLKTWASLEGFTKGSYAQSYVADALSKVRMVLAAAAENRAHPSGLSYAEVLHRKLSRTQIQELANQRATT
ncbi:MAG: hypothetical protein IT343_11595 [Candidatus Melainabacteria bacterium]|nr:hypothetical protein [Candidatus Melainabacteria bacterium]